MSHQSIQFVKRLPNARTPAQGTRHSAGFDLHATEISVDHAHNLLVVDTGLNVSFDPGHVLLLFARSGLAKNLGLHLANGVGVIDADYRGPLKVMLRSSEHTLDELRHEICTGDRIAQAMLVPIPAVSWEEVSELDTTERGEDGFGSTGMS